MNSNSWDIYLCCWGYSVLVLVPIVVSHTLTCYKYETELTYVSVSYVYELFYAPSACMRLTRTFGGKIIPVQSPTHWMHFWITANYFSETSRTLTSEQTFMHMAYIYTKHWMFTNWTCQTASYVKWSWLTLWIWSLSGCRFCIWKVVCKSCALRISHLKYID